MLALRREAEALVSAESKENQKQRQKAKANNNKNNALSLLPPPVSLPALSALSAPLSHPAQ